MPVLLKNDKSALFIHVPKCGGTSFEALARKIGWQEVFSIRGIHASKLGMFNCSPQHFHAELLQSIFDISRFDSVFSIVRHPFNRLKSEYYWQLKQGITTKTPDEWWHEVAKEFRQNPFIHDNHIRPQHEFLVECENLQIFRLEDDGISSALAHLPGSSFLDSAKRAVLTGRIREKRSTYSDDIERQFSRLRPDIEAFYDADMRKLGYSEAGKEKPLP